MVYTSPARDTKIFIGMASLVEELGSNINIEDFENALRKYAETLGNPEHRDKMINDFVLKAETIFDNEQVK